MKKDELRAQDKIMDQEDKTNKQVYEIMRNTNDTLYVHKLREEEALTDAQKVEK